MFTQIRQIFRSVRPASVQQMGLRPCSLVHAFSPNCRKALKSQPFLRIDQLQETVLLGKQLISCLFPNCNLPSFSGTRSGDTSDCWKHDASTRCVLSLDPHQGGRGCGSRLAAIFTVTKTFYQLHKAVKLRPCPPRVVWLSGRITNCRRGNLLARCTDLRSGW